MKTTSRVEVAARWTTDPTTGMMLLEIPSTESSSSSMIHVVVHVQLRPGTRDAFLAEFHRIVEPVRAEAGCLAYGPTVDAETDVAAQHRDEDVVTIVEQWESVAHLKAHLEAPHMVEYRPKVNDFVVGTTLHVLEPA